MITHNYQCWWKQSFNQSINLVTRYVLKFQSTNAQITRDEHKYSHGPVLRLKNVLARNLATGESHQEFRDLLKKNKNK